MRKIKLLTIALLIMVSALCLAACNETGDKQLESIYDKYVTYTEENSILGGGYLNQTEEDTSSEDIICSSSEE